jgi:hypothetical protein
MVKWCHKAMSQVRISYVLGFEKTKHSPGLVVGVCMYELETAVTGGNGGRKAEVLRFQLFSR